MPSKTGFIVDSDTQEPIADVAVYLLNPDGSIDSQISQADSTGDYSLDSLPIGSQIQFSFPGYEPQIVDAAYVGGKVALVANSSAALEEVVVTATKKKAVPKPNYTLPILLGSAGIICFSIWMFKFH